MNIMDSVEEPKAADTKTENGEQHHLPVGDSTEHELGISVYLSPDHDGFSAVSKARYSDFVVHEVGLDGQQAKLESMSVDECITTSAKGADEKNNNGDDASRKRKREDTQIENQKDTGSLQKPAVPVEPSWPELLTELSAMIEQEAAQKIIQFFQEDFAKLKNTDSVDTTTNASVEASSEKEDQKEQPYITLPAIKDKDTRRQVHHWIRSSKLNPLVTADTADDKDGNKVIRLWLKRHEQEMPDYGKFDEDGKRKPTKGFQQRGPKQKRPQGFLRFVLYKENCDTHTAIKQVTQRLGGGGGRGGRGGRNNRHNNSSQVRVGYSGMKDKRGVTTQFCTLHQRSPHEIAWVNNPSGNTSKHSNHHYGGGNSSKGGVAIVRVGNFQYVDEELRLGSLQGNRFDVVLRNVQTNSTVHDRETTKKIVSKSAEALKKHGFINYFGTQRFGKFHDTHLAGIAVLQQDFEKVVEIIMRPKEEEQPWVKEARQKWQQRFSELATTATTDERAKAEAECARFVAKGLGRFMSSEVSVLGSLSRNPLDYKRAYSCIGKTMRMMFVHAVQSLLWNKVASFRIEKLGRDVVIGDLVMGPETTSQNVMVVTQEDITLNKYQLDDVVLPLLGTKSQLPENESGKLYEQVLEEIGVKAEMFQKIQDRDITCPGDYRKLICRPKDVDYSIVEYNDPVQPLLQTDLMKLTGTKVLEEKLADENVAPLLGMVVGFTLPSSAYATIALRELMKKPTSSEYQKDLDLGGSV